MGLTVVKLLAQFILITAEYLDVKVVFPSRDTCICKWKNSTCFTGNYKKTVKMPRKGLSRVWVPGLQRALSVPPLSFSSTEVEICSHNTSVLDDRTAG